ncbi:MAG: pantoate--beta-alanine ligase [Bacteroidia bacterium]
MHVARGLSQLNQHLNSFSSKNKSIGFVPTMGALHQGHLHLVSQAVKQNEISICSIYVNPTQFNDPKDFEKYPRNDAQDIELLKSTGLDIVYFPEYKELYPDGKPELIDYTDKDLFGSFEGEFRPGHFQGVVTVVMRLFEHTKPSKAYFGLKDYQQYLVIKRATEFFEKKIDVIGISTVRNEQGLALSSRNKRLSALDLEKSLVISKALHSIKNAWDFEDLEEIVQKAKLMINAAGLELEYLTVCNKNDLIAVDNWLSKGEHVAVCAAFMGQVRLIDNLIF